MNALQTLIQSGWIAFFAIAILWAEFALLCFLASNAASRFRQLLPNVLAGSCLLAAVGFALRGDAVAFVGVYLGLAFVAHLWDLASRLAVQPGRLRRSTEKLSSPAVETHIR